MSPQPRLLERNLVPIRRKERPAAASPGRETVLAFFLGMLSGTLLLGGVLFLIFLFTPNVCHADGLEPHDPRVLVYTGSYTGTFNGPWTGATRVAPNGGGIAIANPNGDSTDDGTVGRYFDFKALQLQRATVAAQDSLTRIHFAFDKSDVGPQYGPELDRIALILKSNPEVQLRLDGHTDLVGTETYNDQLGERRAQAVREELILRGIPAERVATLSFGKRNPLIFVSTPEEMNRRVESGALIYIPGRTAP
jgi:outer membrane protein OmpA-like peptidoglycan-associated protein